MKERLLRNITTLGSVIIIIAGVVEVIICAMTGNIIGLEGWLTAIIATMMFLWK